MFYNVFSLPIVVSSYILKFLIKNRKEQHSFRILRKNEVWSTFSRMNFQFHHVFKVERLFVNFDSYKNFYLLYVFFVIKNERKKYSYMVPYFYLHSLHTIMLRKILYLHYFIISYFLFSLEKLYFLDGVRLKF